MEETSLIFSQGSVTVLKNMANYEEARVKLTNTQLNKLKSAVKIRLEFAWRITEETFLDEELQHDLFLTARQKN